jgi:hypothetical protein
MLFYVPLESYRERYTMQLSAPKTGWLEAKWIEHRVPYTRVEPSYTALTSGCLEDGAKTINTGSVLDAVGRGRYAMSQVDKLLLMVESGQISSADTIYFDDFWHPGIEALKYACDLLNVSPKMYAYCWAQSVDEYDFTARMASWIRPFERGVCEVLTGVFVANTMLKDKLISGLGVTSSKVHVVGLPFSTAEVLSRTPVWHQTFMARDPAGPDTDGLSRVDEVLFTSRWDVEKSPEFFVSLAQRAAGDPAMRRVRFVACTSAPAFRSNSPRLLRELEQARKLLPNFEVRNNLTKEAYYNVLCQAKVQFNCALQDWTSFTLLEAVTCGCYPIYPNFRSFPEVFLGERDFLYGRDAGDAEFYDQWCLDDAYAKLKEVMTTDRPLWSRREVADRQWIVRRFDHSWYRMAREMGVMTSIADVPVAALVAPYDARSVRALDWGRV